MNTYKVASHVFAIDLRQPLGCWKVLSSHYSPFAVTDEAPTLTIEVHDAPVLPAIREGLDVVHRDENPTEGFVSISIYGNASDGYLIELTQPRDRRPNASVRLSYDLKKAVVTIDEASGFSSPWSCSASLTASLQLAYMIAYNHEYTLLTHASCVTVDGRAYLFLGKSGTGKSTHSRLWLKNIPGAQLLNDDHPILRVISGSVIAYGSPWSGKTDCYVNSSAPVGAIVRISRAPFDAIRRQPTVEAYASLITSFSGLTFDARQADDRHLTIEQVAKLVPCYVLQCLPDDEAARVCASEVMK